MSATDTEQLTDATERDTTQQAPTEQAPAEQAPAEQAPAEQAPAEQAPAEQAPAEGSGPETATKPAGRVRPLPVVLGVLVVAAAVAVGLLGMRAWTLHRAEKDAVTALDSARTRTVQVLSYDPKTVDADVARAKEQLSGGFAAQFDQLANMLILPSAKQQGLTSQVEVKNAALIDAQPERAEVLLFLHQKVSSTATQQPVEGTIQVKTTVSKAADGQWLISNLQPLS